MNTSHVNLTRFFLPLLICLILFPFSIACPTF